MAESSILVLCPLSDRCQNFLFIVEFPVTMSKKSINILKGTKTEYECHQPVNFAWNAPSFLVISSGMSIITSNTFITVQFEILVKA